MCICVCVCVKIKAIYGANGLRNLQRVRFKRLNMKILIIIKIISYMSVLMIFASGCKGQ